MSAVPQRFSPLQRLLHWSMAAAILAMLFIGVGMVSTVSPRYWTLVSIHRPLGIAILVLVVLRVGVRLRHGAPPLPPIYRTGRSWGPRRHISLCTD